MSIILRTAGCQMKTRRARKVTAGRVNPPASDDLGLNLPADTDVLLVGWGPGERRP
jgi:hypothetical protein